MLVDISDGIQLSLLEDDMAAAILLSLFCDGRATPEAVRGGDLRGWWGDALATDQDQWGSTLWTLLHRAKRTADIMEEAEALAEESLRWMIDDGVASSVTVTASNPFGEIMQLSVTVDNRVFEVKYGR